MREKREAYGKAIAAHLEAEKAMDAAIKKQFGPKATRWDYPRSIYNEETKAAVDAKCAASDAQHAAWLALREEEAQS